MKRCRPCGGAMIPNAPAGIIAAAVLTEAGEDWRGDFCPLFLAYLDKCALASKKQRSNKNAE